MQPLLLGRKHLSPVCWRLILESTCGMSPAGRDAFYQEIEALESLRSNADYNTGSISAASCWTLFSLAQYFKPRVVVEVGTFIGKSTYSLLKGMRQGGVTSGQIFTCDFSNDIQLPFAKTGNVEQFARQSSTQMFAELAARNVQCDLLALDGRLQKDDFQYLGKILHANSMILLDDFEGVEKGVANASLIMTSLQSTHNLIYPPEQSLLESFALLDGCTTALVLPRSAFVLSNQ